MTPKQKKMVKELFDLEIYVSWVDAFYTQNWLDLTEYEDLRLIRLYEEYFGYGVE